MALKVETLDEGILAWILKTYSPCRYFYWWDNRGYKVVLLNEDWMVRATIVGEH
jgi:hypothetical protein